jgi:histidine ammonia-lyase
MKAGKGVEAAHRTVRKHIPHLASDRVLHDDITAAIALVASGAVIRAAEQAAGTLR